MIYIHCRVRPNPNIRGFPMKEYFLFLVFPFLLLMKGKCYADLAPVSPPPDVMATVLHVYPHASVVTATTCEIGQDKSPAYGMLLTTPKLQAVVAHKTAADWRLYTVPLGVSYARGATADFLGG